MEGVQRLQNGEMDTYVLQMLLEGSATDVTFVCGDGKVRCHKIILATISPLLKQCLETSGNEDATIIYPTIRRELLVKILHFLYSGSVVFGTWEAPIVLEFFEFLKINIGAENEGVLKHGVSLSEMEQDKSVDLEIVPEIFPEVIDENEGALDNDEVVMVNVEMGGLQSYDDAFEGGLWSELPQVTSTPGLETTFKCTLCQLNMENADALAEHLRKCTGAEYSCQQCNKTFASKQHFHKHKRYHGDGKIYKCPQCKLSFKTAFQCRRHQLVHTGIKPFQCQTCLKSFTRKENLEEHMYQHKTVISVDAPFQCEVCDRVFKRKELLKKHLVVHADQKPFSCHICHKGLTRKAYLDAHLQNVHYN